MELPRTKPTNSITVLKLCEYHRIVLILKVRVSVNRNFYSVCAKYEGIYLLRHFDGLDFSQNQSAKLHIVV